MKIIKDDINLYIAYKYTKWDNFQMAKNNIEIFGARENNLKNINIKFPKNKLVVITGVSGSGKSSLAFDTVFAEGQRRYIESLSTYARQFLGQVDKPEVDKIVGLSPSIAIDQKTAHNNPRSTVGTVTEIYDHLRLLFGRIGKQHCPVCDTPVAKQTIDQMIDSLYLQAEDQKAILLAPLITDKKGSQEKLLQDLQKDGFLRVEINDEIINIDQEYKFFKTKKYTINLVVDRIVLKQENRGRIADSLALALQKGEGFASVNILDKNKRILLSEDLACPNGHGSLPELEPRLFSFNSPQGACPACHGIGYHETLSEDKIIPDPNRALLNAVEIWNGDNGEYFAQILESIAKAYNVSALTPWRELPQEVRDTVLYGSKKALKLVYTSFEGDELMSVNTKFEGVIPKTLKRYNTTNKETTKARIEKYMSRKTCETCHGSRLRPEALAVKIKNYNIQDLTSLPIGQVYKLFNELIDELDSDDKHICERVIHEIQQRIKFLNDVGLYYLTLNRAANTLSGGEAQRIRLATQIGAGLSGVIYVLDEPSIGLHQRDNDKLIQTLIKLRDLGNTIIVVEHDEDTMMAADWLIDIGEGAGVNGGNVVANDTPDKVQKIKESLTGRYLSGELNIPEPDNYRVGNGKQLELTNAHLNNLQNINVNIPLGKLVSITGVSGSGKSSLIMELLLPYVAHIVNTRSSMSRPKAIDKITGIENIDKVIEIDQKPIGRTPHSNPATYTGMFTPIRELFASMNQAKLRGYKPGHFSFNVKGAGRCEHCSGQGQLEIEMHFLPSVYIQCPVCKGKRYQKEILEVKYKGHSISDVLNMTVAKALDVFKSISSIYNKLKTLEEVGLDYITLGQSAITLSGGEAQRIKLASELSKRQTGKTLYILDEPTTGLHWHDIAKLSKVLHKLADFGNSVLVIEHNLDIIKQSDYIIDLGYEGGDKGGEIIATGTPQEIIKNKKSYTGQYLKKLLQK